MKWGSGRLDRFKEDRDRAIAERRRLAERLKARVKPSPAPIPAAPELATPEPRRMHALDVDTALAAARRLKFMPLDPSLDIHVGAAESLNRPTLALLSAFLMSLQTGSSRGVLQWPFGQRDASVLHPLAMLAMLCAPEPRIRDGNSWCASVIDFRTLSFPWRGGATGAVRRFNSRQIRAELIKRNGRHLIRRQIGEPDVSDEMRMLHETLGHLSRLSLRDTSKPHLAHPTLAEFYPVFASENGSQRAISPRPSANCWGA